MSDDLTHDLITTIVDAAAGSPRSRQLTIGPSEVGAPCARQIAYKLTNTPCTWTNADPWAAIVGTATHAWLAATFTAANHALDQPRWLVEQRVFPHPSYPGSCDLYDTHTETVIDHKGLSLDTPLPTPTGWTTMRDVQPGDELFDGSGQPCIVLGKSPTYTDRRCYRITFTDNTSIISDHVHLWELQTGSRGRVEILSTEEAAFRVWSSDKRPQRHLRIRNNGPLELSAAELPIHPYVLGAWLGDGNRWSGCIGKPDDALFAQIERCGYEVSAPIGARKMSRNVYGLARQLRLAGLIRNKHIPRMYLRGSYSQRLELLRGLMDTDGSWNRTRNEAVFTNCDEELSNSVAELIRTLGWKALVSHQQSRGFGRTVEVWPVTFVPFGANPFHLPRKADLVRLKGTTRSRRHLVKSIELTLTVPTQCIEVSALDHTFLCGNQMMVTHNCVGTTSMRAAKSGGPSPQYRTQAHLYGLGWENLGRRPREVAIAYFPRSGFLSDLFVHREPYSRTLALDALDRLAAVSAAALSLRVNEHPDAALMIPSTPGDYCRFCAYKTMRPGDGGCPDEQKPQKAIPRGRVSSLTL